LVGDLQSEAGEGFPEPDRRAGQGQAHAAVVVDRHGRAGEHREVGDLLAEQQD
jgi:hypothetical protein